MLGHLVHMRDEIEIAPIQFQPKTDGWMRRALRALFGKRHLPAH